MLNDIEESGVNYFDRITTYLPFVDLLGVFLSGKKLPDLLPLPTCTILHRTISIRACTMLAAHTRFSILCSFRVFAIVACNGTGCQHNKQIKLIAPQKNVKEE